MTRPLQISKARATLWRLNSTLLYPGYILNLMEEINSALCPVVLSVMPGWYSFT